MSRSLVLCSLLALFCLLMGMAHAADSCTVTDIEYGDTYDLSSLTKKSGENWKVADAAGKYIYLLNVCDNLLQQSVFSQGVLKSCNRTTEGCQIDTTSSSQPPRQLGGNPTISVLGLGLLELKLTGGDYCKTAQAYRSVSILLSCNKAEGLGTPIFEEEDEDCMYIFTWVTSAACPTNASPTLPPPSEPQDCMVIDSNNHLRYDLTPLSLSKGNWAIKDGEYEYLMNVCADVHGVPACAGHSACQTKPLESTFYKQLGLSSGRPVVENGVVKLKLKGGSACHDSAYERQTTIIFTCREDGGLGKPTFLEETDDCMYIFAWETSAACPENTQVSCVAEDTMNNKVVDLGQLVRKDGEQNHVATSHVAGDTASYKINPCGGLVSNDNPCRAGTSICQIQSGQNTGRSLGNIGSLIAMDGDVVMRYADGDICPGDSGDRASSDIFFVCDPNRDDPPRLLSSKNDCQYLFNWKTSAACEKKVTDTTGGVPAVGIVFIVIFVLLTAYLIGGVAYNRFVRGEKGLDQIPHFSLCQACYYTASERFSRGRSHTGAIQL